MRKDKKKLQLSKETITSLEKGELSQVAGGVPGSDVGSVCYTCTCQVTK